VSQKRKKQLKQQAAREKQKEQAQAQASQNQRVSFIADAPALEDVRKPQLVQQAPPIINAR
jgi:hypothetical protein